MSYLRSRPAWWIGLLGSGLAASLLATAVAGALAGAAATGVLVAAGIPAADAARLAVSELAWPFRVDGPAAGALPAPAAAPLLLLARIPAAFLLAAVSAVLARAYLLLRWSADGEPPSAQVRPGEEFRWEEGEAR